MEKLWRCGEEMLEEKRQPWRKTARAVPSLTPLTHFVQETMRSATKPYSIAKPSRAALLPPPSAGENMGRWLLPSAFMTYSSHFSFRSVKKAMWRPSGDQAGDTLWGGLGVKGSSLVSRTRFDPSAFMT